MKQYTLYYSVRNGGDGSAYPTFMESEELCRWDQDHMDGAWGESCDGSFSLESESDIIPISEVLTKESYFLERYVDSYDEEKVKEGAQEFLKKFFPKGLPKFKVVTEKINNLPSYLDNKVFIGETFVTKIFRSKGCSGKLFEDFLNNLKVD